MTREDKLKEIYEKIAEPSLKFKYYPVNIGDALDGLGDRYPGVDEDIITNRMYLRKPVEAQPDETIDFIYNLLIGIEK